MRCSWFEVYLLFPIYVVSVVLSFPLLSDHLFYKFGSDSIWSWSFSVRHAFNCLQYLVFAHGGSGCILFGYLCWLGVLAYVLPELYEVACFWTVQVRVSLSSFTHDTFYFFAHFPHFSRGSQDLFYFALLVACFEEFFLLPLVFCSFVIALFPGDFCLLGFPLCQELPVQVMGHHLFLLVFNYFFGKELFSDSVVVEY